MAHTNGSDLPKEPVFRAWLTSFLDEEDPMELLAAGSPAPEYEPEVTAVIDEVQKATSELDLTARLQSIFRFYFGRSSETISESKYTEMSKSIYQKWNTRND